MTYISVRKSRHSHGIISGEKEFVINLTTEDLAFAADWCGVKSGADHDKFSEMKLTPVDCDKVSCPMIGESPVNLECKVKEIHSYPSHDMFVAEIVGIHVSPEIMDEDGRVSYEKAGLLAYVHGMYYGIKKNPVGRFGFSVMKRKTKKRLNHEARTGRRAGGRKDTGRGRIAGKRGASAARRSR